MPQRLHLLLPALASVVTGALYAYVARLVLRRAPPGEAGLANALFAVWWTALGALSLSSAAFLLPVAFGVRDLAFATALLNFYFIVLSIGLWGLLYYLVYLYFGSRKWLWPLTAFYGAFAFACLVLVAWLDPVGLKVATFTVSVEYARDLVGLPLVAFILLLTGPVLVAALAYGSLFFRVEGRSRKFRVALVSGAFVLWFGWSSFSALTGLGERHRGSIALELVNRAFGLLVPLLIIAAYRPPAWVRRGLGVTAVGPTGSD